MLGRGVNDVLRTEPDPRRPWGDVLPLLLEADLRLANLECAITEARKEWDRTFKPFHFRADPPAVKFLTAAHLDGVALANNHILDYEARGLIDTLDNLDRARIGWAGAGRDSDEARRPAIFDAGGLRVALVSITDNEPEFAAGPGRPGAHFLPVSLERDVLAELEEDLERAHDRADLVVLSNHWGPNFVERPSQLFRDFAHAAVDRGADVYFGHSAHLVQGVELYRGRPVLYDTGDFLDDYAVDPELRNDASCLFRLHFQGCELAGLELVPVTLSYAAVGLATGDLQEWILRRLQRLSAELETKLERRDGRLWLPGSLEAPVHGSLPSEPAPG